MGLSAPFPFDTPVSPATIDPVTGKTTPSPYFSQEIVDWLLEQQQRAEDSPEQIASVSLSAQSADIAATPVPMPDLTTGRYRVSVYTRVTRAASTSSELIVTIAWTDGAVALSSAGATLTGNLTTTFEQRTLFLAVDANASITYQVDYTSVGGTTMQFKLEVIVEALPD